MHEIAAAQANLRIQDIMAKPASGVDDLVGREFTRGEFAGISLFMKLPQIRINEIESSLNKLTTMKENKDGLEESVSS